MATLQPLTPVPPETPMVRESMPSDRAGGFGDVLADAVSAVDRVHREKDHAIQALATDQNPDIHNTMIAVQRADLTFRMMMQVRNKAVAAYQEIMRMNI